jgi:hypothetical protein
MDKRSYWWDALRVSVLGGSRQRLASLLNTAFAEGLLSEQTHSYRLGLLFGPRLVDRQQLVGDLTVRRQRLGALDRLQDSWSALVEGVKSLMLSGESSSAPLVLALDGSERDCLLVGRHPRCDVVLTDPSVSRRHAQVTFRDGVWVIQDLASTNGTSVNGAWVGRTALRSGDVITLGSQSIQVD